MLLTEILAELDDLGVEYEFTETEFRYKGELPEALRAEITKHKAQLLRRPEPDNLSQFKAAYLRHDLALAEEVGITARIEKGVVYCKANPKDLEAAKLLDALRRALAGMRQSIEWEAVQLHELEKEIIKGTPASYICGTCYVPVVGTCETCWPRE